jgi:hypothetical protein
VLELGAGAGPLFSLGAAGDEEVESADAAAEAEPADDVAKAESADDAAETAADEEE